MRWISLAIVMKAYEELDRLPPKHEARKNPALMIERAEIQRLAMPPFTKIKNRVEVIFYGATPELEEHENG